MNRSIFNQFFIVTALYFICAYVTCTPPPVILFDTTIPFPSVAKKSPSLMEIRGFCTISLRKASIKTRLITTADSVAINAMLMDEFGIPLAIIESSDSSVKLVRYFPPLTKKVGKIFSLGISYFMKSFHIDPPKQGIIEDTRQRDVSAYYVFSNTTLDSIVIFQKHKQYTLQQINNSFNLLNEDRDTVCKCVWE